VPIENGRSLAGVMSELKDELKEFITTRIEMLKSEMKDKVASLKMAAVLIACGLFLGITAWFVLTAAAISIVATAFYPSVYAYFFGFLIVGVAYLFVAVILASFAFRELKKRGLTPERTIRVLKQDQVWLQSEARQQI
jgi:membrane protein implicated in regulation of membrane protease activity